MIESAVDEREEHVEQRALTELLGRIPYTVSGAEDAPVNGIAYRSDRVMPGDAFFCVPGFAVDGHDFAADAVSRGAVALVVERDLPDQTTVPRFIVPDARVALSRASSAFYGEPSGAMQVVGITGTNGKTTTTYLVDSILRTSGRMTGVLGTVETRIGEERLDAARTTPESADLHALLARMRDASVEACVMEVSSHAIDLHRVDAVRFSVAAFTNLTQDHLDYHHTLEEYFSVKRRLFTDLEVGHRVVNVDDEMGARLASEVAADLTVGTSESADVRASDIRLSPDGSTFVLHTPMGDAVVRFPLAAAYNVSNALVAAGVSLAMGVSLDDVVGGLESAEQVPGRLERIDAGQGFAVLVDYAHTPDSISKALGAVREVTDGRVIAVFGAGGDRDPDKRPLMGRAAGLVADHVIVTSDNPRSEDPVGIVLQVQDGLAGTPASYEALVDRREAIAKALSIARPGDAIVIAGKGHEDYQQFADRTIHFDDREVAREELMRRC